MRPLRVQVIASIRSDPEADIVPELDDALPLIVNEPLSTARAGLNSPPGMIDSSSAVAVRLNDPLD